MKNKHFQTVPGIDHQIKLHGGNGMRAKTQTGGGGHSHSWRVFDYIGICFESRWSTMSEPNRTEPGKKRGSLLSIAVCAAVRNFLDPVLPVRWCLLLPKIHAHAIWKERRIENDAIRQNSSNDGEVGCADRSVWPCHPIKMIRWRGIFHERGRGRPLSRSRDEPPGSYHWESKWDAGEIWLND
jgi:hypothetical protein